MKADLIIFTVLAHIERRKGGGETAGRLTRSSVIADYPHFVQSRDLGLSTEACSHS